MRPLLAYTAVLLTVASSLSVKQAIVVPAATPKPCQTPECLALSALITSNMNQSADPCEDFNEYACGHYRTNTYYDPDGLTWSEKDEPLIVQTGLGSIQKQLTKRLFEVLFFPRSVRGEDSDVSVMYRLASSLCRSCTAWLRRLKQKRGQQSDLDALRTLFDGILNHLMKSIESTGSQSDSFERALGKMVRFDIWPMIRVSATIAFKLQRAKSGPADRNISRVALSYKLWTSPYDNSSVARYAGFFKTLSAGSKIDFQKPQEFLSIARDITRNVSIGTKQNCFSNAVMNSSRRDFTIRELDALSKCIDPESQFLWTSFFEGVLDGSVDKDTRIEFRSPTYAIEATHLVSTFKRRSSFRTSDKRFTVHFSFLIFDWLLNIAQTYIPENIETPLGNGPTTEGRPAAFDAEDPLRSCIMHTRVLLGPVVERMFQRSFHEESFDHVLELIGLLRNATIKSVRETEWISPSSREAIVDKIISLKTDVGFNVLPVSTLKKFYASTIRELEKEEIIASQKTFGTLLSFAMCARAGRTNNLLTTSESASTFTIPDTLTVNAFNYGMKNKIVFPMGILSPFLYHKSYPDYMNLGGIGVVIGHEIGHGFDDTGHELNTQGVRGHFWDNKTEQGFLDRMKCVKSRFGAYELVPGRPHMSTTTVGNDISDLMGIRSGFGALQLLGERGRFVRLPNLPESLTPERLFFVQAVQAWCAKAEPWAIQKAYYASAHSPPHLRIRGMMENSRDFARVFQCRSGQAMNPRDKCEFW